jgi:hypothetical protein
MIQPAVLGNQSIVNRKPTISSITILGSSPPQ